VLEYLKWKDLNAWEDFYNVQSVTVGCF
jgi:hypothetical protein